jgi:radical SAM superfamily enzyme YgiQ (UPF0313 family)
MNKSDLLLVAPPTRAYSIYFSFALLYIAAFLEKKGLSVEIIDLRPAPSEGHTLKDLEKICVERILAGQPRYVGFTCLTADYNCIDRIAQQLRQRGFDGKFIVGGHHPTFCPEDFFVEKGTYDYAVLGEGEITLLELLNCLETGGNITEVNGIAYRDGDTMRKTTPRMLIEDISVFPPPAYHLVDMSRYTRPTIGLIRHILIAGVPILTTRGCPYRCTYCGNPSLWATHAHKKILRARSVEVVLNEITFLKEKYGIEGFGIADDAFTLNEERVKQFCHGIRDRKLNLVWACQTHANLFTENMAAWMKDAGCIQVEFGVESGSNRILKEMKKGTTVERIKPAFELCKKYKLRTLANLMINTPTETTEDLKATIAFARQLRPTIYSYAVTVPLVGTEVYEKYVHPKLTRAEYDLYLDERAYHSVIDKRFKLAAHNKNLAGVYRYLHYRFMWFRHYFDALLYFLKKYRFYKKSGHWRQYRSAIIRKYTAFNRLTRVVNQCMKKFTRVKTA